MSSSTLIIIFCCFISDCSLPRCRILNWFCSKLISGNNNNNNNTFTHCPLVWWPLSSWHHNWWCILCCIYSDAWIMLQQILGSKGIKSDNGPAIQVAIPAISSAWTQQFVSLLANMIYDFFLFIPQLQMETKQCLLKLLLNPVDKDFTIFVKVLIFFLLSLKRGLVDESRSMWGNIVIILKKNKPHRYLIITTKKQFNDITVLLLQIILEQENLWWFHD